MCPSCRAKWNARAWRRIHREDGCERLHAQYVAEQERARLLLARGEALRRSALDAGDLGVHVLFTYENGRTVGRYMSEALYASLPLPGPASLSDFEAAAAAAGETLRLAPDTFEGGRVSKAAAPAGGR
jgi:hypothetical protein